MGGMSAVTDLVTLNGAEKRLVRAAEQDTVADLRAYGNGERPVIRASLLRELCAGRRQWHVKDRIRMTGGQVKGRLDLSDARLAHPLHFTDCVFDEIDLRRARAVESLVWTGNGERNAVISAIIADEFEGNASLAISGVTVTGAISLHWANVRGDLRLSNSHLMPGSGQAIAGRDMRVGGTLFLDGPDFYAEGEVCLRSAHVGGDVNCRHARFDNPSGRSIDGDNLVVDGEILMEGYHGDSYAASHHGAMEDFRSDGEVSLQRAQVHRLWASGGKFASTSGFALHAEGLHAEDGVYLDRGFEATGEVRLAGAHIGGELCCTRGTFGNPGGLALNAERVEADDVYLDDGFAATGQVRFTDAQVNRRFNATRGSFHNGGAEGYALDADGLSCLGDVFLNEGFDAVGEVRLSGAEIHNQLNCTAGSFDNPSGMALFADGLVTPGTVYLDKGFRAIGQVRLARATVGRQFNCTDGTFDNQHGTALDLTGLVCTGDVLLTSTESEGRIFRSTGRILLNEAQITRDLNLTQARLHGDEGLNARGVRVGGCLTWQLDPPPEGFIDLTRAQLSRLDDTPGSWPEDRYKLTGITFQRVGRHLTVQQRKDWLRRTDVYSPDAYQQLAQIYRTAGRETDAQNILIANQRDRRDIHRGRLHWSSRVWSWFIDRSVGYGYRLHRPFIFLLILLLVGGVIYRFGENAGLIYATQASYTVVAPQCPIGYPCFASYPYTMQLLIPVLDLRESAYWFPDAHIMPWGFLLAVYTWMMIFVGWAVVLALIPGISRYIRGK